MTKECKDLYIAQCRVNVFTSEAIDIITKQQYDMAEIIYKQSIAIDRLREELHMLRIATLNSIGES